MDLKRLLISLYFGIENLYYNILDEINKVIPVYKYAIEPLEKRGVPSMPFYVGLFLLVILSIVALGALITFNATSNKATAIIAVHTAAGLPVNAATITYTINGVENNVFTNSNGAALLNVKKGQTIVLKINAEGYLQSTSQINLKNNERMDVVLTPTATKARELDSQFATNDEFVNSGFKSQDELIKDLLSQNQSGEILNP